MKTFKFLSGAVCLFVFLSSCEADPINEDIDNTNFKVEVSQQQYSDDDVAITDKPNEQISQRTEGEDDKPESNLTGKSTKKPPMATAHSRTEGEDDKPNTGKSMMIANKPAISQTSFFTEGEDDKPESGLVGELTERPSITTVHSRTEGEDDKPNN